MSSTQRKQEALDEQWDARALAEARALVRDLFTPRAAVYWPDFLFHIVLGWAALVATIWLPPWSWQQALSYSVSVLALYRSVIFIHELSHLRPGALPGFRLAWNVLCGCLLLVPSFTYSGVHNHHHKQNAYGTAADGEYLPFARLSPLAMIGFLLSGLLIPVAVIIRFTFLTPLGWVIPPLARLLWRYASSLTIDFSYSRGSSNRDDRYWRWQEFGAWLWSSLVITAVFLGWLPARVIWVWAAVLIGIFLVNGVRTLVAHRYRFIGQQQLSLMEQFQDSVDVPGQRLITALWAPVGLRFHATHHLFPGMPYHNLHIAHQRLNAALTDKRWYEVATEASLWSALGVIWREALKRSAADEARPSGEKKRAGA